MTHAPEAPPDDRRVGVVIVNYAVDPAELQRAIRSVVETENRNRVCERNVAEIIVVDNASPRWRDEARAMVEAESRRQEVVNIRWHQAGENRGFAAGVNLGVSLLHPDTDFVLFLNPDARVAMSAVSALTKALTDAPSEVLSVAPKMLLDLPADLLADLREAEPVIDSVGNAINAKGEGINIGLGQPDLGQFDEPKAIFGPCFGAALFRREAFAPEMVGPLNEDLFLYYEDVEWNWRAQNLGFSSRSVPSAVVHHRMSTTMRDKPYGEKFRLTEQNLLLCALTHFETRSVARVLPRRMLGLLKGSLVGRHYPTAGLRALGGFVRRSPKALRDRKAFAARRVRSDSTVTSFGQGHEIFFDPVRYLPVRREAAREAAERALDVAQKTNGPVSPAV